MKEWVKWAGGWESSVSSVDCLGDPLLVKGLDWESRSFLSLQHSRTASGLTFYGKPTFSTCLMGGTCGSCGKHPSRGDLPRISPAYPAWGPCSGT